MVRAVEHRLHQLREVAALLTRLVDRHEERRKAVQVHQKVVYEIFDAPVVAVSQQMAERHAVGSAERVVGDEGEEAAVAIVGQVFKPFHVELRAEIFHAVVQPRHALLVALAENELVHLVLMDDALEPRQHEARHEPRLCARLAAHYFINIYREDFAVHSTY